MPEWPNGLDSKSSVRVTVPWVRIPPSPPTIFAMPLLDPRWLRATGSVCYVQLMKKNHVVIGLLMGAALGVVFGAALGNVGLGIPIGAGIGLVLGLVFRATSRRRKGTSA